MAGARALLIANAGTRMSSDAELLSMGCPSNRELECGNSRTVSVLLSAKDAAELLSVAAERGPTAPLRLRIAALPPADYSLSSFLLWLLSMTIILVGSLVATSRDLDHERRNDWGNFAAGAFISLNYLQMSAYSPCSANPIPRHARALPRGASAERRRLAARRALLITSLGFMLLVFFMRYFLLVVVVLYALAGALAAVAVLSPVVQAACPPLTRKVDLPLWEPTCLATILLAPASLASAAAWFVQRESAWALRDAFSTTIVVLVLRTLRLRDPSNVAFVLALVVVYDAIWVLAAPLIMSQTLAVEALIIPRPSAPPPTGWDAVMSARDSGASSSPPPTRPAPRARAPRPTPECFGERARGTRGRLAPLLHCRPGLRRGHARQPSGWHRPPRRGERPARALSTCTSSAALGPRARGETLPA